VSSSSSTLPKLSFELTNTSKKAKFALSSDATISKKTEDGVRIAAKKVTVGTTIHETVQVQLESMPSKPLTLTGILVYTTDKDKEKEKEVDIILPQSTFNIAKSISSSTFQSILADTKNPSVNVSGSVTLKKVSFADAVVTVSELLNLTCIDSMDTAATLYGVRVETSTHVCVMIKSKSTAVSIDVKTNSKSLSDHLLNELTDKLR